MKCYANKRHREKRTTTSNSLWGQVLSFIRVPVPNNPGTLPLVGTGSGWKWTSRQDVARESAARRTISRRVLTQTTAPVLPLHSTLRSYDWGSPDLSQNCFLLYTQRWLMLSWLNFDALRPTRAFFHVIERLCVLLILMNEFCVIRTLVNDLSRWYDHISTVGVKWFIVAEVWHNRDEKQNFLQRFDAQLVREEKRLEVEEEFRVQVGGKKSILMLLHLSWEVYENDAHCPKASIMSAINPTQHYPLGYTL